MALTKLPIAALDIALPDIPGILPAEKVAGFASPKVWQSFGVPGTHIFYAMTELTAFRKNVLIPANGVVFLSYNLDFTHRGISAGAPYGSQYQVGLAARVRQRMADSEAGLTGGFSEIADSTAGAQVYDYAHHYTSVSRARVPFAVLAGKWYTFTLAATAHTDAGTMNGVDGACQLTVGGGTQHLIIEYQPGMTIEA